MGELATVFHFDSKGKSFEDLGKPNGMRFWMEEDLRGVLDYQTKTSFRNVITRAMQTCLTLHIPMEENFILTDGQYKLTRFACYLIAMNGDPKKPNVASAQVYFAAIAETFQQHLEHAEGVERALVRAEMTDGMKSLSSTAKQHGVQNYAFFLNAGYRGMYNMNLKELSEFKGIKPKELLLDRMGKEELAGNLFRITQTDAKIKNENLRGQRALDNAAYNVGKTVRNTMKQISGTEPEHLPVAEHIKDVKKKLKQTNKKFKQLDSPKKKPRKKAKGD